MTEAFLHYIWKHQYFDKKDLKTASGELLSIINPGLHNSDAGPDFKDAIIKIDGIEWRGQVEIHTKASDWARHKHQSDGAYNSTVLHVVLKEDSHALRKDGTKIPALELEHRIYLTLIQQYEKLVNKNDPILCESQLDEINDLTKISMLDKALMQRVERKSKKVLQLLKENNSDWEETTYQLLAENFGFKVNAQPFLALAQSLPYKLIKKHADNMQQIEAMLYGQAGFLNDNAHDDYVVSLRKEYSFLKSKYDLQSMNNHQWKFLRLRPANFPTLRIAQFAVLLSENTSLFSFFTQAEPKQIIDFLRKEVSDYWRNHYKFGTITQKSPAKLGKNSAMLICINTIVPILVAYGKYIDDQKYIDAAIDLLEYLPAEQNKITRLMRQAGYTLKTAFDTQAAIELYNNFCLKKRCLDCNVGAKLIRP